MKLLRQKANVLGKMIGGMECGLEASRVLLATQTNNLMRTHSLPGASHLL